MEQYYSRKNKQENDLHFVDQRLQIIKSIHCDLKKYIDHSWKLKSLLFKNLFRSLNLQINIFIYLNVDGAVNILNMIKLLQQRAHFIHSLEQDLIHINQLTRDAFGSAQLIHIRLFL